jgi:hypothetical protein
VKELSVDKRNYLLMVIFAFISGSALLFIYSMTRDIRDFPYDSGLYWMLSNSFGKDGFFFPDSFRGYVFPFFLHIGKDIFGFTGLDEIVRFRIFVALFASFILIIFLPESFLSIANKHQTLNNRKECCYFLFLRLFLMIVFIYFWDGLLLYPLSDFYAFAFISIASVCAFKTENTEHIFKTIGLSFICGVFTYAAYNTRTIYLFGIIPIFILFIRNNGKKKYLRLFITIVTFTIGVTAISIPQYKINIRTKNIHSIAVITNYRGSNSLFTFQLKTGLSVQLYQTYIGDKSIYASPAVSFIDPIGKAITAQEPPVNKPIEYIKLFFKYPFEFFGIYLRHFINMLNPLFGEIYIKDILKSKMNKILINYLILFIVSLWLVLKLKRWGGGYTKEIFNVHIAYIFITSPMSNNCIGLC